MAGLAEVLAKSWWEYDPRDRSWFSDFYHGFNLFEGAAWCVLAVLVVIRFAKRRRSRWEVAYGLAFASFGASTRDWWETERRHFMLYVSVTPINELQAGSRLIPETKPGDALQMAVSAAHEVDYLLTWNYAHLANPISQEQLEVTCRAIHLRAPLLVSPETIPQLRFGQDIHRTRE
ncbi:MAG TPA: hypothetical protein VGX78_09805 [Pirellulales bacterium]|nr:hypothetical protein [Pirellulales bacterium]